MLNLSYYKKYWGTMIGYLGLAELITFHWIMNGGLTDTQTSQYYFQWYAAAVGLAFLTFSYYGYVAFKKQESFFLNVVAASACFFMTSTLVFLIYDVTLTWNIEH